MQIFKMIKLQSRSSDNPKTKDNERSPEQPRQSLEETTKDLLQSLTLKIDPVIVSSENIQTVSDDNTTRWKVNSEVPLDFYFNPLSFIFLTMTSSKDPFNQARKLKVIEKCLELAG